MLMTRSLAAATLMILAACSRPGTLYGDIFLQPHPGTVDRAARINVIAIPATEAFEREWASVVAAFQVEIGPVRQAQKAASDSAQEVRLAWDRSLAARGSGRTGTGRRIRLSWMSTQDRQGWNQVLAAED
ncbi:MAG TPA: hypothetical protein VLG48_01330, partial [Candidatus Methylomirabilis sp.]|nr:hypothetical protein [Candidatus Methylomirabilis sp.]